MDGALFNEVAFCDLAKSTCTRSWLWDGFIGHRQLTLFTAFPKTGKTTLLSALLAKRNPHDAADANLTRQDGSRNRKNSGGDSTADNPTHENSGSSLIPNSCEFGDEAAPSVATLFPCHMVTSPSLAGRRVLPGPSVVASEEPADLWLERGRALGFRDDTVFFCRPFAGKPKPAQLAALCERIAGLKQTRGIDLVIFDSLVNFLPRGAENNPDLLIEAMTPLRRLCEAGLAVVAAHHPAKGSILGGPNARGTVALTGFVDIALELRLVAPHDKHDRRRHLTAWSRFPDTPPALLIELTEDGQDYRVLGLPDEAGSDFWPGLRQVLEEARRRLDRPSILAAWPSEHPAPSDSTLYRLLESAAARGQLCRDGAGERNDPYRYWLPHRTAELAADIACRLDDLHRAQLLSLPPEVRRAAELESAAVEWDEEGR